MLTYVPTVFSFQVQTAAAASARVLQCSPFITLSVEWDIIQVSVTTSLPPIELNEYRCKCG